MYIKPAIAQLCPGAYYLSEREIVSLPNKYLFFFGSVRSAFGPRDLSPLKGEPLYWRLSRVYPRLAKAPFLALKLKGLQRRESARVRSGADSGVPNGPFRACSAGGELTQGKPWVEWREVKGCLGWFFVPKGQEDSEAQGFNPGNRTSFAKSPERAPDRMR
jgi:hypothetical protein